MPRTLPQPLGQAPAGVPAPARVPANRWPEIEVAALGALEPTLSTSVVIAGAGRAQALLAQLAALEACAYPKALLEVVIVSEAAQEHSEDSLREAAGDIALTLAGAGEQQLERAGGELLVLLAPGEIPSHSLVQAHARWHHAVSDAVSIGTTRPLSPGSLPSAAAIAKATAAGTLEELLGADASPDDEALETFLERTRNLTERRGDLFVIAARQNVALRSETARAVGGLAQELPEALARLDLAYRLELYGAVFIPEREARSFAGADQAAWPLPEETAGHRADVDPRAAALIPVAGFRPERTGRVFERPAMVVCLDAAGERSDDLIEAVDSVLRGRFSDLELRLSVDAEHPERDALAQALAGDPRVRVGPDVAQEPLQSPYAVFLPALAVPDERTFEDLHGLIRAEGVGALHVTVPGELPRNAMVEVVATGPRIRARRLARALKVDDVPLLGELFGERWISGVEVSLRRRGFAEPQVTEHGPLAPATDLAHERAEHLKQRSRARKQEGRADRHAERAVRERLRARAEKARADRLEARLARSQGGPSHRLMSAAARLRRAVLARVRG